MAGQVHVAIPGEHRARAAPGRQTTETVVHDGDRLDQRHILALCQREKGGPERQHPAPVGTGAFGEQQQVVARRQSVAHVVALPSGGAALAGDENGAAQLGDQAHAGPARDLVLGDEARVQPAAQHGDVQPRAMVGRVDHPAAMPAGRGRADHAHVQADHPGEHRPVEAGEPDFRAARQDQQHNLHGGGHHRPEDRGHPTPGCANAANDLAQRRNAVGPLPGRPPAGPKLWHARTTRLWLGGNCHGRGDTLRPVAGQ